MTKGIFIVLEGMDCSGKTSQLKHLLEAIEARGYKVHVTREPGGTEVAEEIRTTLLKKREEPLHPLTEMLLFAAARHQHVENVIKPMMEKGFVVISDRFTDSSYAYQGAGRGLMTQFIDVEQMVLDGFRPDHVLYFDIPLEVALIRQDRRSDKKDRLDDEELDFKKRVYCGYVERADEYCDEVTVINANTTMEAVTQQIKEWVDRCGLFPEKSLQELIAGSFARAAPTELGGLVAPMWLSSAFRANEKRIQKNENVYPSIETTDKLASLVGKHYYSKGCLDFDGVYDFICARSETHPDAVPKEFILNMFEDRQKKGQKVYSELGYPHQQKDYSALSPLDLTQRMLIIDERSVVCVLDQAIGLEVNVDGKEVVIVAFRVRGLNSFAAKLHPDLSYKFSPRFVMSPYDPRATPILVTIDLIPGTLMKEQDGQKSA